MEKHGNLSQYKLEEYFYRIQDFLKDVLLYNCDISFSDTKALIKITETIDKNAKKVKLKQGCAKIRKQLLDILKTFIEATECVQKLQEQEMNSLSFNTEEPDVFNESLLINMFPDLSVSNETQQTLDQMSMDYESIVCGETQDATDADIEATIDKIVGQNKKAEPRSQPNYGWVEPSIPHSRKLLVTNKTRSSKIIKYGLNSRNVETTNRSTEQTNNVYNDTEMNIDRIEIQDLNMLPKQTVEADKEIEQVVAEINPSDLLDMSMDFCSETPDFITTQDIIVQEDKEVVKQTNRFRVATKKYNNSQGTNLNPITFNSKPSQAALSTDFTKLDQGNKAAARQMLVPTNPSNKLENKNMDTIWTKPQEAYVFQDTNTTILEDQTIVINDSDETLCDEIELGNNENDSTQILENSFTHDSLELLEKYNFVKGKKKKTGRKKFCPPGTKQNKNILQFNSSPVQNNPETIDNESLETEELHEEDFSSQKEETNLDTNFTGTKAPTFEAPSNSEASTSSNNPCMNRYKYKAASLSNCLLNLLEGGTENNHNCQKQAESSQISDLDDPIYDSEPKDSLFFLDNSSVKNTQKESAGPSKAQSKKFDSIIKKSVAPDRFSDIRPYFNFGALADKWAESGKMRREIANKPLKELMYTWKVIY